MRKMYSLNQLKEIANKQVQEQVSSGNLTNLKVFEEIVDKDGHKRFIEENGTPLELEGFESVYCKWSLSGTHIMFVLAGNVASTTTIPSSAKLATFNPPQWIMDKIYPIFATKRIEVKGVNAWSSGWTSQTITAVLTKESNSINFETISSLTLTDDRSFRLQYDLVIDNE